MEAAKSCGDSDEKARIKAFVSWWNEQDGCEDAGVTLQDYAAEMRGAHATADLAEGHVAVSVAHRWLITPARGRARLAGDRGGECGRVLAERQ